MKANLNRVASLVLHRFRQPIWIACALALMLLITFLLSAVFVDKRSMANLSGSVAIGANDVFRRDFSKTPFGIMDAYDACEAEARAKLGAGFLRATNMPLSTRYDDTAGIYKVVLDVDVGNAMEWADATIYCDIDPVAFEISYYKEIRQGQPSILSRTMSVLGSFLN